MKPVRRCSSSAAGTELKFHSQPTGKPRSTLAADTASAIWAWSGMRSRFSRMLRLAFHYLPERIRVDARARTLGPSGGWFIRDKVIGKVPLHLGMHAARSRKFRTAESI
jgi:hypothetical protein